MRLFFDQHSIIADFRAESLSEQANRETLSFHLSATLPICALGSIALVILQSLFCPNSLLATPRTISLIQEYKGTNAVFGDSRQAMESNIPNLQPQTYMQAANPHACCIK